MLPPPASALSPAPSSCSSDTGDVLIRSTRILLSDRGREAGPGPGPGPRPVQITVQRLRDPPVQPPAAEQQQQSSGTEKQQQQQQPKPRQKPDNAPPLRAAARLVHDRRMLNKPEPTTENRKPRRTQPPAAESSPGRRLSAGTHSDRQPGHDLLTSRFATGGRGVVLAALKQRSQSAPHRREVKVQLLDPGPLQTSSQDAPGLRTNSQDAPGLRTNSQDAPGLRTNSQDAPGLRTNSQDAVGVWSAAPLIKAQSEMEARVSHLADGVQKLLQADRECGDRGRSLSQQTLLHLETLHSQQLRLQSQLLESALRIVMGHAPVTATSSDLTASGQPARLQVTHLDAAAKVLSNQQRSSPATRATVETDPVAMATPRCDRWPEQTRDDRGGAPSVSTATQPATGNCLQSSTNHSQAAARRASEMLGELGRLKTEMKILLTPEDSLKTTSPVDHQSQQNQSQSQSNHFHSMSQQTEPQQSQTQQSKSQQNQFQSHQVQSQQNPSQLNHFQSTSSLIQSHQRPLQQIQSQLNQIHQTQSRHPQSALVQKRAVVPSMLEEAGWVLRKVQRQKKVLEENLESLLRAKTGEVLHCQLEAVAANRDRTEAVRIKKTVDAWINTLTKDIQAEMSSENTVRSRAADSTIKHSASRDAVVTSQQRAAGSSAPTGRGRPVSALRGTGSKTAARRGSRGQTAGHGPLQGAEPDTVSGRLTDRQPVEEDGESYLTRLYGRAPYEGLRRTLKKSPYLRFSSPASPLSRKPRPRLVESVRGVKVKSCKTQTCLAPPLSPSPGPPQHHYIISSSHLISGDPADLTGAPAETYAVPMAIPLGRPRMDSSSRCLAERQQEVTSPPTAPVVAVDDGASELQSHKAEQLDAVEVPPPPPVDIIHMKSDEEEDEEEGIFPETDFLSVADVVQQEELSVVGEEVVELDGGPSPPAVLYQGPAFPPQARSALPAQDQASVLGLNRERDALENRLVEWVEQQLMSRMISEIYRPPPSDPAHNISTDQSESEKQSVTSDIVEAAGGAGLQLFVDSNTSVDSALIRQLVNEVLTEHVALMLGCRDTLDTGPEPGLEPPKPGPGAHQEEKLVPLVPTPIPTPPSSPTLASRETPPLTTPPPSEPTSLLSEESPQPITAPEYVATPTSSPEPAHPAESRPAVHQAPPPLTWGDAELPLDEERPEEHLDPHPQLLVMSVAEEEPPLSSLPPPFIPSAPCPSPPPPGPDPRPAFSSSSSEDSSSSSSSSSSAVTTGTDAALKHISEGELLISVSQLAAMTEEEAVCSFSSSLQELQEMDFDPPSEGQVRGHDLLLTLLTKMEQGVTHTHRGERPQPEGSWGGDQEEEVSIGEVRDDRTTKPHRTTNPKTYSKSATTRQGQTSSPGQMSQCADVSEVTFESTNQGSVTVGDLMLEPIGTLTSDLQTDQSLSPSPPHLENTHTAGQVGPVLVRQYDRLADCPASLSPQLHICRAAAGRSQEDGGSPALHQSTGGGGGGGGGGGAAAAAAISRRLLHQRCFLETRETEAGRRSFIMSGGVRQCQRVSDDVRGCRMMSEGVG